VIWKAVGENDGPNDCRAMRPGAGGGLSAPRTPRGYFSEEELARFRAASRRLVARRVDKSRLVSEVITPSILRMRRITSSRSASDSVASSTIRSHLPLVECTAVTAGRPVSRAMMRSPPRPSIPIIISPRTGASEMSARVSTMKPAISPAAFSRSSRADRRPADLQPFRQFRDRGAPIAAQLGDQSGVQIVHNGGSAFHLVIYCAN
jgi:hypothetical protein